MLRGQFGDKCFIRIGSFAAQFVIEVHHADHDAQFLAQLQQQKKQRDRVRSARHSYTHTLPRPQHFMLLQVGKQLLLEGSENHFVSESLCSSTSH